MKMSSMAKQSQILAVDIGSSSVRSALFEINGKRVVKSSAARQYSIRYTQDDGAELDPQVVLRATRSCVDQTMKFARGRAPVAISGSAFWHGLLGVSAKGKPVTPIYTWADARASDAAAELRGNLSERAIQLRTGCMLRAPFWPAKLRWLNRRDIARWISPATWIFEKIFGLGLTSHSMASGTGLYNLRTRSWDEELCKMCRVDLDQLGPIGDREGDIFSAIGDGAASNLGCGADAPDRIAINIGTSAAARIVLPQRVRNIPRGLFQYVVDEKRVVVGGAISNAGNLHRWCLRELKIRNDTEAEKALVRTAAANDSLIILPFWVQERAPTWPNELRGMILGLRPTTSAADILRATTTSVFYRLAAIIERMPRANEAIVSGGILHSPASLAILADALGRDIRICAEMESSLRGAATHGLQHLGFETAPLPRGKVIRHQPALAAKHRERRARQEELERALTR
ncbi:MAG TPA: FGGY family carbohydrate kinase [Chthoniobacterales bacterium]